ncbi:MAG: MBL fold metallo-hydrolase [Anaerolineae bacterium]|nr:MAG: MBL fold metallo-hydrolase [Anaerolineae bacterium]
MKQIGKGVFIEDSYPGVTLGALVMPRGVVMIDAPPRPDDGRAWLADLRKSTKSKQRLLVNLDSHPDRTLGARVLDCAVLAHNETLDLFRQRSSIFKAQGADSGADWEGLSGLSGLRWLAPGITFDEQARLHMEGQPVLVTARPGPEPGACWVELPQSKIVFIGDAVMVKQPPFLAFANLEEWLETLDTLLGRNYKGWKVVASRGGVINEKHIRAFRKALAALHLKLEKIGPRKRGALDAAEKLIPKLLVSFESPARAKAHHTQRLRYGLKRYLHRNYGTVSTAALGESESS